MRRRTFCEIALSFLCCLALVVSTSFTEGCAASDEAASIIDATLPVVQGIAAVVALADPVAGPAITAAVALYTGGVHEFDTVYAQWKTANPENQPALLAKVQAAGQVLQVNLNGILSASRVLDPTKQNTINLLFAAALSAVTEVIQLVGTVQAAGGTTSALDRLLAEGNYGGGREPQTATTAAKKPTVKKAPISAAHMKKDWAKKLAVPTGDPQLDKIRAEVAAKLK